MTMKVCCRQKTFSPRSTKIYEISMQLIVSVTAYPYVKNQHHSSIQSWHIADLTMSITFGRPRCV